MRSCLCDKPIEQQFAKTFGPVIASCDEIVDVHEFSVSKIFTVPIAGDRADFIIGFAVDEEISVDLLSTDLGHHCWFVQVRAQLVQDRVAALDVVFGRGESDGRSCHGRFKHPRLGGIRPPFPGNVDAGSAFD